MKTPANVVNIAMMFTAPKGTARTPLASRPMAEEAFTIAMRLNAKEGLIPIISALTPKNVSADQLLVIVYGKKLDYTYGCIDRGKRRTSTRHIISRLGRQMRGSHRVSEDLCGKPIVFSLSWEASPFITEFHGEII